YDLAIIQTTQYVLENLAKIDSSIDVDFKIIDGFKSTGGFNDEVDLTYAAIISLVAAKKLEKDQTSFIFDVIKNSDSSGIVSVEKYIENQIDISDIKKQLSYPGTHHDNPLYQIFDQIFYGPQLYKKLFNDTSNFSEPGLIEQDDVILNDILFEKLQKKFNSKIAMVTGRGKESVSYSLKSLLTKFNLDNSMFLEDEPRELAKPNPQSLLNSIQGMNCTTTLYVGDSMEDFIMAKRTTDLGHDTIFCGIIGTSKNPQEKLELFEKNGAVLVLDSINLLPKVVNYQSK
ncbi:MAG: HAD-IA family hydrolase, partial [Nitrosopumilus sp.]|nr:HAD-IA family hydrolase [Nitrosopumilus sp.]